MGVRYIIRRRPVSLSRASSRSTNRPLFTPQNRRFRTPAEIYRLQQDEEEALLQQLGYDLDIVEQHKKTLKIRVMVLMGKPGADLQELLEETGPGQVRVIIDRPNGTRLDRRV
ncbi:unnamed protein product [Vitrella brassicaformis CCMP3155]|uniref:Uncharacterized protein n=1 Tax=Vitrella brassicaformis (strain CCMP3155) TaxID=1169540 RepID=A0A0G4F766_VITBC|nr:unnamed protein product [Vitrella brassicaformis CCMP3155]|eukprot:CEM08090.1 unnamed protein product [Vitrella brassicaformis CCMP3155]